MSSPEALFEYESEHEGDIEAVIAKLRERRDPPVSEQELKLVEQQLKNPTTAYYHGSSFAISRDLNDHYRVVELPDERRAA